MVFISSLELILDKERKGSYIEIKKFIFWAAPPE